MDDRYQESFLLVWQFCEREERKHHENWKERELCYCRSYDFLSWKSTQNLENAYHCESKNGEGVSIEAFMIYLKRPNIEICRFGAVMNGDIIDNVDVQEVELSPREFSIVPRIYADGDQDDRNCYCKASLNDRYRVEQWTV